jgi:microcystin degradation protein MlrC
VPIVASLDLHANVTRAMLAQSDGLVAYRTYPHIDMAATGQRAAGMLLDLMRRGQPLAKSVRTLDYLTGIPSQCTTIEPGKRLYELLERLEHEHGSVLSFTPGFPMADFPECGMAVFGMGPDEARVQVAVAALRQAVADAEGEFRMELFTPDEAVRRAVQRGAPGLPVVLADTQDNPGAGGNGDTTGLLSSLLKHDAPGAVLGLLVDPASAKRAHEIGENHAGRFRLGEISGVPGHVPIEGEYLVERLGDGKFTCTGPMFHGFRMDLGRMALLRRGNVRVVLASVKCQAADQAMFRHVGIEPRTERILALKSSVHFRADFEPIAREVLVVAAPGPAKADPTMFSWTRLRPGLRLRPLGPAFAPVS